MNIFSRTLLSKVQTFLEIKKKRFGFKKVLFEMSFFIISNKADTEIFTLNFSKVLAPCRSLRLQKANLKCDIVL